MVISCLRIICTCAPGWTGEDCSKDVDECESNPCLNGATCIEPAVPGKFECICLPFFTSTLCELQYDPCDLVYSPCINNSTCLTQANGSSLCVCKEGFEGAHCEIDTNECISSPCQNQGHCLDGVNSYRCVCRPGFSGVFCETDINECFSSPCVNNGTCLDFINSFQCNCTPGYFGSLCELDVNECDSLPCLHGGSCINMPGGYQCLCSPGFTGERCDVNINECASTPCLNNGDCIDSVDYYKCICLKGFTGTNCETNIDECESNPCLHGRCIDLVDEFKCYCEQGWTSSRCDTNINDCASAPCFNGGFCQDLLNAFICICPDGYTGKHCEVDINVCNDHLVNSTVCFNGGTCIDGPGRKFICRCPAGFSGQLCEVDIDECTSSPCLHGSTCNEFINGYTCICNQGWAGVHCEEDINECQSNPCIHGICIQNDPGFGYTCFCRPGFVGPGCDQNYNDCLMQACSLGFDCVDGINNVTLTPAIYIPSTLYGGSEENNPSGTEENWSSLRPSMEFAYAITTLTSGEDTMLMSNIYETEVQHLLFYTAKPSYVSLLENKSPTTGYSWGINNKYATILLSENNSSKIFFGNGLQSKMFQKFKMSSLISRMSLENVQAFNTDISFSIHSHSFHSTIGLSLDNEPLVTSYTSGTVEAESSTRFPTKGSGESVLFPESSLNFVMSGSINVLSCLNLHCLLFRNSQTQSLLHSQVASLQVSFLTNMPTPVLDIDLSWELKSDEWNIARQPSTLSALKQRSVMEILHESQRTLQLLKDSQSISQNSFFTIQPTASVLKIISSQAAESFSAFQEDLYFRPDVTIAKLSETIQPTALDMYLQSPESLYIGTIIYDSRKETMVLSSSDISSYLVLSSQAQSTQINFQIFSVTQDLSPQTVGAYATLIDYLPLSFATRDVLNISQEQFRWTLSTNMHDNRPVLTVNSHLPKSLDLSTEDLTSNLFLVTFSAFSAKVVGEKRLGVNELERNRKAVPDGGNREAEGSTTDSDDFRGGKWYIRVLGNSGQWNFTILTIIRLDID
nr:PREDICTED: sushi, nidogen and EGF-like domain-containing protein 1 [Latimeria chalumnae]|eukprot:XP_014342650.1 PREDICTED: sushi, nidogen and EGF-like domain-containing protein 1 [Latimeria chalumnae]